MKENTPWLEVIHCFNHRLELALKDAFQQSPAFKSTKSLIHIYTISTKQAQNNCAASVDLQKLTKKVIKSQQKLVETDGWISNTLQWKMPWNTLVFTYHTFLAKWEQATVPIHLAIYLDVLTPLRCLSLSLQSELHNPVKQIKRVHQFTWTMTKLKLMLQLRIKKMPPLPITTNFWTKSKKQRLFVSRYNYQKFHYIKKCCG